MDSWINRFHSSYNLNLFLRNTFNTQDSKFQSSREMFGSFAIVIAFLVSLGTSSPLSIADPGVVPVSIRECYTTSLSASFIPPFTSWLRDQPTASIPTNMGFFQLRHDVNGTCLQVQVYNWSCDHVLNVTGPGLANAVKSIAEQCDGRTYSSGEITGPSGFGYYKDLETGHDFTNHLWIVNSECYDGRRKSACSPGA